MDFSFDDSVEDPDYKDVSECSPTSSQQQLPRQDIEELESAAREDTSSPVKKFSRKSRVKRKKARQSGESYKTLSGKTVQARVCEDLGPCRKKCKNRFNKEDLKKLFSSYWELGDYNGRKAYIAGLIVPKEKATIRKRTDDPAKQKSRQVTFQYHLEINNERKCICKKCFLKTFGETKAFLYSVQECNKKNVGGIVLTDARGKKENPKKWSDEAVAIVDNHIMKFPAYESHYCRAHTSKRYLASNLNLAKMYKLYTEVVEQPVSRNIYEKRFHSMNLCFKKPKVDTCHKCDELKIKIDHAESNDARMSFIAEREMHHEMAELAYKCKASDKDLALQNPDTYKTVSFDLQQCLPTPFLNSSIAFYKRQLWVFNLTIHDALTKEAHCFMWDETIAPRGANQIASCVYKFISTISNNTNSHFILYSDCCSGQNRNSHLAGMFMYILESMPHIITIDHKFMVPGHSHMECDADHSVIERMKKKTGMNLHHPRDWLQLVRSAGPRFIVHKMDQSDFLNFSDLYRNCLVRRKKNDANEAFKWSKCKWMRFQRPIGVMQYKHSLRDNEDFFTIDLRRRGHDNFSSQNIAREFDSPIPISAQKKNDLMSLMSLIDSEHHSFYNNLAVAGTTLDIDPDLESFVED